MLFIEIAVGDHVVYIGDLETSGEASPGVVTKIKEPFAFVRFEGEQKPRACAPDDLIPHNPDHLIDESREW